MKITKQTSKWGVPIIVFACLLFFAGYWALLLGPIQDAFVTKNLVNGTRNLPSLVGFGLFGLADGFVFAAIVFLGFNIAKPKYFGITYADFDLDDMLEKQSFWWWSVIWALLFFLFTLLWRGDI